jgi:hypothetical protein
MKAKYKVIGIVVLAVIFIFNLKIGCPGDFDNLLRYMFHEDFPKEYEVVKKSETSLFQYLFGKRECSYEIEISQSDNDAIAGKLMGTKFWRRLHPEWDENPCPYLSGKYCDENELQNISKIVSAGLICYANYRPSIRIQLLSCYDY